MKFQSPKNKDYIEEVSSLCWLWVLLFAPIYFLVKGNYRHAIASALLSIFTIYLSAIPYAFFAKKVMRSHYLRQGWIEVKQ